MLQSLLLGFKIKAFHFYGRSSRAEFWPFYLTSWLVLLLSCCLYLIPVVGSLIQAIVFILVLLCQITATMRRLHDLNLRGWWLVIPYLLPLVYFVARHPVYVLYPKQAWILDALVVLCALSYLILWGMCLKNGTVGNNRFGTDPLSSEPQQDFVDKRHLSSPEYLGDPWRKFKSRVEQEKVEQAHTQAQDQNLASVPENTTALHTPGSTLHDNARKSQP